MVRLTKGRCGRFEAGDQLEEQPDRKGFPCRVSANALASMKNLLHNAEERMADVVGATSVWERWTEATKGINGGFETRLAGPVANFRGSFQRFSVLGIRYASIETNARSLYRGADTVMHGDRHHCLVYQARGRSMVKQGKRVAMLNPSDMVLLSPAESCEFVNRGLIRQLSFNIPEQILFDRVGSTDIPTTVPIRSDSALGSLVATLVLQVHSRSKELSSFFTPALDMVMASLVTPLLREERGDMRGQDDDVSEMVSTLTVTRFIASNLRNANMSPRYISRALGCSVRHVHRAFEGAGTTVSAYIKQQRLIASAEELASPRCAEDSITEIALRWGFSEVSHFSRSFRAEFGMSPREYRECSRVALAG